MYINIIVLLSSCRVRWQHCIPCTSVLKLLFGKWGLVEKVGIVAPPVPLAAVQLYSVQTTHPPSFNLPLVYLHSLIFGFVFMNIWFQIGSCVCFALFSCASQSLTLLSSTSYFNLGFVFTQLSESGLYLNFKIVKLLLSSYFGCLRFQSYHLYLSFIITFCNFCLYWNIIMFFYPTTT